MPMTPAMRARFEQMKHCPLTWHPERGGKLAVRFNDLRDVEIGPAGKFNELADVIMNGAYYPPEIIKFHGLFEEEGRPIQLGDRVLQRMTFGPVRTWTMTEIWVAERSSDHCCLGYVTTACHHGRGIWAATLYKKGDRMWLKVEATSGPQSIWFWIGLPIARAIQMYTWKAAIERIRKLCLQ